MFTGIIQELGRIESLTPLDSTARIRIHAPLICQDAQLGDSIASNGVCLTAAKIENGSFEADLSSETLNRTTFKDIQTGAIVNLEPALRPTDRMGGHIVSGHVDGVGRIISLTPEGDFWNLIFSFPADLSRYIAEKGSITIDGASLTVTFVEEDRAGVALVPFTIEKTNLSTKREGDRIHLEVDMLARYVERLLANQDKAYGSGLTMDTLKDNGFLNR
ncbi:MAG: riboflavin synthase [Candidatus Hinthialibacter antarcticus]|nr:riboflavin synthase [Candidatus Hinthialibacter antarcticus]